jgi:cellulose synthase/poly-beta-1,6-N-acetylglucosamine synthase-like glycosyltransferase
MTGIAILVVGATLLLVVYHHLVFPLLLSILAKRQPRPAPSVFTQKSPSVTFVIPAHNERRVIAQKIENCAGLQYPGAMKIVLALDGCTDDTLIQARAAIETLPVPITLEIIESTQNIGKIQTINNAVSRVSTDIVALSDASCMLSPDALEKAARYFADPRVAFVSGAYHVAQEGNDGEYAFWEHQRKIKEMEACLGGPLGAHGAFYVFRRSLFTPLEVDIINDDFIVPGRMLLIGHRGAYAQDARVFEIERSERRQELRRRIRLGAGNLQQALRLWKLADPRRRGICFLFLSGKGLRGILPVLIVASGIMTTLLGFQISIIVGSAILAGVCLLAMFTLLTPRKNPWAARLQYWSLGYMGTCLGAVMYLAGLRAAAWKISAAGKPFARPSGGLDPIVKAPLGARQVSVEKSNLGGADR